MTDILQPVLHVKRLNPEAVLPKYQTPGAACFDLHAVIPSDAINERAYGITLSPNRPIIVSTGLAFEVPEGYVMLLFSRSGQGFNHDTRLANCVGVIDSDYRGEVRVKLTADGYGGMVVNHHDRVAQAMILKVRQWALVEVDELSKTQRGDGAYGSTGV